MIKEYLHSFIISNIAGVGVILICVALPAHAYLLPVIAGLGWLIAVIIGGVVACATFIWLNIVKIKHLKQNKKKEKEASSKTQSKE